MLIHTTNYLLFVFFSISLFSLERKKRQKKFKNSGLFSVPVGHYRKVHWTFLHPYPARFAHASRVTVQSHAPRFFDKNRLVGGTFFYYVTKKPQCGSRKVLR